MERSERGVCCSTSKLTLDVLVLSCLRDASNGPSLRSPPYGRVAEIIWRDLLPSSYCHHFLHEPFLQPLDTFHILRLCSIHLHIVHMTLLRLRTTKETGRALHGTLCTAHHARHAQGAWTVCHAGQEPYSPLRLTQLISWGASGYSELIAQEELGSTVWPPSKPE